MRAARVGQRSRRCATGARSLVVALMLASACAFAIEDRADIEPNDPVSDGKPIAWKLTLGSYHQDGQGPGVDVNLRGNTERHTFWIGHYRLGEQMQQTRAGLERQVSFALGRLILSGQIASKGFIGGSITWEASSSEASPLYGLVGVGRTNRAPYVNLNFDPNDSILLGCGWRVDPASQLTVFHVWDDRLGTGQRVTHLVYRRSVGEQSRITLDMFRRQGSESEGAPVQVGRGASLTWDHASWFVRLVRDPKANFTDADMTRVSVGMRF